MAEKENRVEVVSLEDLPQPTWSLEQLGEYCRLARRKEAECVWRMGRALLFAKALLHRGTWMEWLQTYCPGPGQSTINRYMLLAKSLTEDEVRGMNLTDAYRQIGISAPKPKQDRQGRDASQAQPTLVRLSTNGKEDESVAPHESPSEALTGEPIVVREPIISNSEVVDDEDEDVPDPRTALLEELGEALPDQIYVLRDTIGAILRQDSNLRDSCWCQIDHATVAREIAALKEDLAQLEASLHPRGTVAVA